MNMNTVAMPISCSKEADMENSSRLILNMNNTKIVAIQFIKKGPRGGIVPRGGGDGLVLSTGAKTSHLIPLLSKLPTYLL
jgi:hypothetical protein